MGRHQKQSQMSKNNISSIKTQNLDTNRKTSFSSSGYSEGGSSSDLSKESGSKEPPVVIVRNAVKKYGSGERQVLDNLDMTVRRGDIYGLLGASGCGKTSLLSVIVGQSCNKDSSKILGGLWIYYRGGGPLILDT